MMLALGPGRRDGSEKPLARLVYIEPAAPPAPPLGIARESAPVVEAPVAPAPPVVEPVRPVVRLTERTKPRRAQVSNPPAPAAAPKPAPAAPAGDTQGVAGGAGSTIGGTATGVASGVIGSLGTAPHALRDVAAPPELVDRVLPEYPRLARQRGLEGQVVLEVVLDQSGRVEDEIRVLRSLPLLDAAAIAAVKRWRFRPARDREGRPMRVVMEIPVRFVLR